ncbi:MAG: hypothetical protein J6S82_03375, partial [Bacteroidales bacterium]|nr:hypothetical protein [Bacteroidales bacterium]
MTSKLFNGRAHFAKRNANLKSKKLLTKNIFNMKSKVLLPMVATVILAGAMFLAGCEKEKKQTASITGIKWHLTKFVDVTNKTVEEP